MISRGIGSSVRRALSTSLGNGGGGSSEVTAVAVRQYLFESGAELVDTGLDESNLTNVNTVTFSGGVATFDKANARHLTFNANAGSLAQMKDAIGYGLRLDFQALTVPDISSHQYIFGNIDDGTDSKALQVIVDSIDNGLDTPTYAQGRIEVVCQDTSDQMSIFQSTGVAYSDGETFNLSVIFNIATQNVTVTKNGVVVPMTAIRSDCKIGEVDGYQYVGRIGAMGRATAFSTQFDGSLGGVTVTIDGVGDAKFATLDEDSKPFTSGVGGYNTYRIPAIINTPDYSEVLVFCEGRVSSDSDNGDVDIVLKKSTDGGATWGSTISIANDGNTNSDPSPVYDSNGRLHLFWVWRLATDTAVEVISGTAAQAMRVYHAYSDDDGDTWSAKSDITSQVAPTNYRRLLSSDSAIRLANGRILWVGSWTENNTTDSSDKQGFAFYSDDDCATFERGDTYGPLGADEVSLCQVPDGTVIINQRDQKDGRKRLVGTSTDGGETIADLVADDRLICPRNNAGMISIGNTVYFINTAVNLSNSITTHRRNLLLRRGTWNGTTINWTRYQLINAGLSGYSKIRQIGPRKLGVVWEDGSSTTFGGIKFQSFDI